MKKLKSLRYFPLLSVLMLLVSCGGGGGGGGNTGGENQAPAANAGTDQAVEFGSGPVLLDGSGSSDPNGDNITFSWVITNAPGGSVAALSGADTMSPEFTPDQLGMYQITLTVSDGSLSGQDIVNIDVAANISPVANAGPDQDVNVGVTVLLDGSASTSPGGALTYTWTQVAGYGPDVTGGSGTLSGVNPGFTSPASPTTLLFDLRVNDGGGDSFADRVQINVYNDVAKTIFVSPGGNDANDGSSRDVPFATLANALSAAEGVGGDVYLDINGAYDLGSGELLLIDGVSVYGGYDSADNWSRLDTAKSTIQTTGTKGVVADGIVNATVLEQIEIVVAGSTTPGQSLYGLFVNASTGLTVANSAITVGATANGDNGTASAVVAAKGNAGSPGQAGCEDSDIFCGACSQPQGGSGGSGPGGQGGVGGFAGHAANLGQNGQAGTGISFGAGGSGTPSGNGDWNPTSPYLGQNGASGTPGNPGTAGSGGYELTGYIPVAGAGGSSGMPGAGGGGGGGGGGGVSNCDSYGGAGGGGGAGGAGGVGGGGGGSAGGSFGVYMASSELTIADSTITTGDGGAGGSGAAGKTGGAGGQGGWGGNGARPNAGNPYGGVSEQDDGSNGGRGGYGGSGGNGGAGGGGAGGPSIAILRKGGSQPVMTNLSFSLGSGGVGGSSAGNSGPDGEVTTIKYVP